jgi:hypothetical protein
LACYTLRRSKSARAGIVILLSLLRSLRQRCSRLGSLVNPWVRKTVKWPDIWQEKALMVQGRSVKKPGATTGIVGMMLVGTAAVVSSARRFTLSSNLVRSVIIWFRRIDMLFLKYLHILVKFKEACDRLKVVLIHGGESRPAVSRKG